MTGAYRFRSSVKVGRAMVIAEYLYERARRDHGSDFPSINVMKPQLGVYQRPRRLELNQVAIELRALLGTAGQKLFESHARAISLRSEAKKTQRLVELALAIESVHNSLNDENPRSNAAALAEAAVILHLLRRWGRHPQLQYLQKSLVNEYEHTLALLAIASALEDMGNSVAFVSPPHAADAKAQGKRIPDLHLLVDATAKAHIEVKAPRRLWRSVDPAALNFSLTRREADEIIQKLMKKARTRSRGQLGGSSSLLAIVGTCVSSDLEMVTRAARGFLKTSKKYHNLAGIMVLSLTSDIVHGAVVDYGQDARRKAVHPKLILRIEHNPFYLGPITVQSSRIRWIFLRVRRATQMQLSKSMAWARRTIIECFQGAL
jgi:hypothetical protein